MDPRVCIEIDLPNISTLLLHNFSSLFSTYELILRQQPKQSRMCGVGEKADRRPIDPPPIVQLIVKAPPSSGGSKSNGAFTSYLQNPYYFMHASLVEKDTREDVLLIKDTRSKEDMQLFKDNRTKATTGSSVSSLYPLKDFEDGGTESGFFVFPDLSVRMEGTYRLKFCLYEMVGKDVHFCAFVISDPLVVYSAKKFPGMEGTYHSSFQCEGYIYAAYCYRYYFMFTT
ncbi:velvet factor-domain-containing protein [Gamsiella multidivaricata]|uniref:velvet factor-domain-containing protein n=1 Tax=Gamsiella multidivaricata TaxID=101098 RepID=UPI002220F32B|nr:velvet factor-domain-containing protein [Gamsiella multidivaricata]KAI7817180.1 velvet factor-domain-containing protein [Gamsiella multidivaricata]